MYPFPSHTPWLPFHLRMLFARHQNIELFTTWTWSLQQEKERPFKNNKHWKTQREENHVTLFVVFLAHFIPFPTWDLKKKKK